MKDKKQRIALYALVLLALIWGYNWVVMKIGTQYAPPLGFAALRLLLGSLLLFAAMVVQRKSLRPEHPWAYFWIGIFQSGGFVALATWAVISGGAGKVSILSYTMPLWVAVLAWPLLGERLRGAQAFAIAVAAGGILLILGFWNARESLLPDLIAVVSGLSWAIGVVLTKQLQVRARPDVLSLTTWQMFFGGLLVAIVALFVPEHQTHWATIYIAALAYNVVLASAVAYLLWIFILQTLPAREASMGTLVNPIVGIIAAWLQLGETPSVSEAAGMALVVLALLILSVQPQASRRPAAPSRL